MGKVAGFEEEKEGVELISSDAHFQGENQLCLDQNGSG